MTARALLAVTAPSPPAPNPSAAATAPGDRRIARYAWALLLARIYEALPLWCPLCGAQMRSVAFIIDPTTVREILACLGEPISPPLIAPARGPPLGERAEVEPAAECDSPTPPAPAYQFDQRLAW